MGIIAPVLPTLGGARGDGEAAVRDALNALITEFNGHIGSANMENAPLALLSTLTVPRINAVAAAGGNSTITSQTNGDAFPRIDMYGDGTVRFGSGAAAWDTQFSRDVAGVLRVAGAAGATGAIAQGGKSIIATTESRTNVAYGTLTTPDQVTVVLPADGLIRVTYQATWQESVLNAARAAIFIGSNQLKNPALPSPTVTETSVAGTNAARDSVLASSTLTGLFSIGGAAYTGDVTTGQTIGVTGPGGTAGECIIDNLPAGTYTISVQFKASSGSVTAKNRRLRVRAEAY